MKQSAVAVEDVSLAEVKEGLANGSILLVDVREPDEYKAGHIPGSTLNALQRFDPAALPRVQGKRVVLSCRSGKRSLNALALAQAAGRDDVRAHFTGGMLAWVQAGEPVEV
ncbi:MAG: rhodanese-like domain-containing protein [Beijerinckiaceae bacterium]